MRSFCTAKASHIFSTKNIGVFEILLFEINVSLTNDVVSFEQPGPVLLYRQAENEKVWFYNAIMGSKDADGMATV